MSDFHSCSISLERMDTISLNFVYALILTRSRLELLPVIFPKCVTDLWLLIDVRVSFQKNVFTTNGQNFINF